MDEKKLKRGVDSEMLARLRKIVINMSIEEEIRLIKIIKELLSIDAIPLIFCYALFMAISEEQVNVFAPKEIQEIENMFYTLDCDVEYNRISTSEIVQNIERLLNNLRKRKQKEALQSYKEKI